LPTVGHDSSRIGHGNASITDGGGLDSRGGGEEGSGDLNDGGGGGGSDDGREGSGEEEGDAIVTVSLVHLLITTGGKIFTIPGLIYFSRVRRMQYMASSIIVL
jgi:hypothetical protein